MTTIIRLYFPMVSSADCEKRIDYLFENTTLLV